jgi:hypothetical protein
MCSSDQSAIVLPEPSIQVFLVDGYLQEYRSMEDYQRGEGEELLVDIGKENK